MAVLERSELEASPLADLHAIANQIGLDGFRRLRKAELIDAILGEPAAPQAAPADTEDEEDEQERPARTRRRRSPRTRRSAADADATETTTDAADEDAEPEDAPARTGTAAGAR